MRSDSLEARITRGNASYLSHIKYDAEHRSLKLHFVVGPGSDVIDRILIFRSIQNYSEQFHDEGEYIIEGLIGLTEELLGDWREYCVHTDIREITFSTRLTPEIRGSALYWCD